jgi:diguanylate cyclase (GGDEF)-like protein/PAS domain S-box-containing protein
VLWNGILTDITEHKLAEEALRRSQTMLARAEAIAHVGSWDWEVATDTVTWSDELYRILQRDPAAGAPSFADHAQLYIAEDLQRLRDAVEAALTQGTPYELDLRAICKDGATVVVLAVGHVEIGTDKHVTRLFGFIQDVTERRAAERALHESEQRYHALFDHISSGVAIYEIRDPGQAVLFRDFNRTAERLTGVQRKDLVGKSPAEVFPGIGSFGLLEVLRRVGTTGIPQQFPVKLYQDERLTRWYANYVYRLPTGEVVAVFDDVTALKDHERQLEWLAYSDALTALPNRVLLHDRLRHAMAQTQRRGQYLAVVYLDLDGFKAINDRHGHDAGDQLLIALSRRMKQTLRESDTLARLGGDEFVAVLADLDDRAAGVPLLNRLLAAAAAPVPLGDVVMQVSASLGVTFYPQPVPGEREGTDALDADQLLRQADQAMYLAKRAGKNRYHVFNVEKDHRIGG